MRIATYNTQAGLSATRTPELLNAYLYVFRFKKFPIPPSLGMRQAVADAVSTKAGLLCVNEVPAQWISAVRGLLAEAGYIYSASGCTHSFARWNVGTIVASKDQAQALPIHLPRENTLQGGGGSTALYVPHINTSFIGTHLGWEVRGLSRVISRQIESLTDYCLEQKNLGRKVVVAGDFNTNDLSRTLLATLDLRECVRPTFPSWAPKKSLDHILCDPSLQITNCNTFRGSSDHLGLYADALHPSC